MYVETLRSIAKRLDGAATELEIAGMFHRLNYERSAVEHLATFLEQYHLILEELQGLEEKLKAVFRE